MIKSAIISALIAAASAAGEVFFAATLKPDVSFGGKDYKVQE